MKITEHNTFSGRSYQICIKPEDNLEPWEIVKCFRKQYPKEKAVITFSKILIKHEIQIGIIIVGLKLK